MVSLFPIEIKFPPGFIYVPEFLHADQEETLIFEISKVQFHPFIFQGFEAKRKVASFGYDYSFDKRTISRGTDIPNEFRWLIEKVNHYLKEKHDFAELLITQYPMGSVINWHRDAPPFDIIAGISLLHDCIFRFRPHDTLKQGRKSIISFPVRRRSLYIMKGPSRSAWEHSILPVKSTRYSITLRSLKE
jgi:alkylated DNA repair dioxygenase AlkB